MNILTTLLSNPLYGFLTIIFVAMLSLIIIRRLSPPITLLLKKFTDITKTEIDNYLLDSKLVFNVLLFIPVVLISNTSKLLDLGSYLTATNILIELSISTIFLLISISAINISDKYLSTKPIYSAIPIFAGVQLLKILAFIVFAIVIIATLLDKSPFVIFTGLGAATAIIMLIFKDVISGFASGIHLVLNKLLARGDWITVPSKGIDGDVIEVGIATIKIRNFDKTIASIPTADLAKNVFHNWTGMQKSGGRRIKRNLLIDASSITFLSNEQLSELSNISILNNYIDSKKEAVDLTNKDRGSFSGDQRMLTNIGTYRAYIKEYLRSRGDIHEDGFTFLVRQLQPTEHGVPLQVYVFTNTVDWIEYEGIQSDVFDHLLSMTSIFGLRIYQRDMASS